jgi:hypothetical protein
MQTVIINSLESFGRVMRLIKEVYTKDKYLLIKIYAGVRTLPQNAAVYVLYGDIADQCGHTEKWIRCYCKYTFGRPILCRRPEGMAFFNRLSFETMTHDERILFMEYIDVTSIMDVKELKEYIDEIIKSFAEKDIYLELKKPPKKQKTKGENKC